MQDSARASDPATPRVFATTRWSVVLAAGQGESAPAQGALDSLCRAYWYPIYAYVRRKGYRSDEAQDLTQEFFAQLIAKEHFRLADRTKGKFRAFLMVTLDYFLAREWSRAHRQKRGGQFTFISRDEQARRRNGISWSPPAPREVVALSNRASEFDSFTTSNRFYRVQVLP
jgi:DNA-directed RNA polymerase specialized sigma24 family protein